MSDQPLRELVREMREWFEAMPHSATLRDKDGRVYGHEDSVPRWWFNDKFKSAEIILRLLNGLDLYHDALKFYAESWNWPGGHGDPGHQDMGSNVAKLALIGERHPAIRKEDDSEREAGGTLPGQEGGDGPREDHAEG